jgi:hypothetical protein
MAGEETEPERDASIAPRQRRRQTPDARRQTANQTGGTGSVPVESSTVTEEST